MPLITRRAFVAGAAASLLDARTAPEQVDEALRSGIERRKIPAAVGSIAQRRKTLYAGAFGLRDASGIPVRVDSIFRIASMTKPITTVAALQLVEQGKVDLSEPIAKHLPQLANLDVLEGFDASGKPVLRPARTPITLRHLLTQTSGLCYSIWDERMFRYSSATGDNARAKPGPLMFEPGTRWQYGQGTAWAARFIEATTGATLEDYFQEKILRPFCMQDTSYIFPEAKFERLVADYHREANGELKPNDRRLPSRPTSFNGDGGLYSTAADYVRFMQMILNRGSGPNGARILKPQTVESMLRNQIGDLSAGKMRSFRPSTSADVDFQPGHTQKWGFGFLINTTPHAGGRSAGSGAWAGLNNTFFWIDPRRDRCAVLLMQYLPFADKEAVGLLDDFEKAAYRYL
ncbi:MAG TPA: serine hydrolase domain-containing protein [Bryobacteraceae bacterium]|nr:serine hydrolase domain-containing protein [Bryobacteraceae bacterium]